MSHELSDEAGKPHGCLADYCVLCPLGKSCGHYDSDDSPYEEEEDNAQC